MRGEGFGLRGDREPPDAVGGDLGGGQEVGDAAGAGDRGARCTST